MKEVHHSPQLDEVAKVLAPLHDYAMQNGIIVLVGGGAIRDTHFGRPYNDIDVYVLLADDDDNVQDCLMGIVEQIGDGYEVEKVYGREDSDYTVAFEGEEDRFDKIWKFKSSNGGPGIDVCYYTSSYATIAQVIDSHGHSCNQFAGWFDSQGFVAAYLGQDKRYGKCYQLRRGVTDKRIEKIQALCAEIGWTYEGVSPELKAIIEFEEWSKDIGL